MQKVEELTKDVTALLAKSNCLEKVPIYQIEQFCTCYVRWLECEEKNTALGLIAKHPSGAAVESPYVKIGLEYMRQANDIWDKIQSRINVETKKITYKKFMEEHNYGNSKNKN